MQQNTDALLSSCIDTKLPRTGTTDSLATFVINDLKSGPSNAQHSSLLPNVEDDDASADAKCPSLVFVSGQPLQDHSSNISLGRCFGRGSSQAYATIALAGLCGWRGCPGCQ